jgi:hypothetical protein
MLLKIQDTQTFMKLESKFKSSDETRHANNALVAFMAGAYARSLIS